MTEPFPVFDGHNDTLLRLALSGRGVRPFLEGEEAGHIDLPRAGRGGLVGGLFACYTPSQDPPPRVEFEGGYRTPLASAPELGDAQRHTMTLLATLCRLERESGGALRVCGTVAEIRAAIAQGALAMVPHIEGAEAIDGDLDALEVFHRAGVRSLGPVWSRENRFGIGVPFDYPGSPDTGPGLTDAGKDLVRACNELGIVVDLSHLNERGFWDVASLSDAPLVASHSNAHAICPAPRNLTDDQLAAIRESGGLVGLNFAVQFLDPGGRRDPALPLEVMVRHVDHLVEHLGLDGVALGSDFDGCILSEEIGDVAGLPRLVGALREHGYDESALRRICIDNWLDLLERTWR